MTPPPDFDHQALAEFLRKQHDVVTRGQSAGCGMTDRALRYRIRRGGAWQRLLPGVYLAATGTPTTDQRDMAALLYGGPGSVLTAAAALRRLELKAPRLDGVDVLVPAARRRQNTGFVRVLRTTRLPEQVCVTGQIRFAMAARAVADAARGLAELREVRAVVADSVQRGWCRVAELGEELRRGPVVGSALFRQVLGEVADGVRSITEGEFRDLVKRAGLPMPMFNARLYAGNLFIAVADAWWPDAGVAAEVELAAVAPVAGGLGAYPAPARPDDRPRHPGAALRAEAGQDRTGPGDRRDQGCAGLPASRPPVPGPRTARG